ncbi:MAG: hypothetical protein SH856_09250 [Flavobacteriales bacterium]|nr:hypothetical protein [Flavobacteriales bacterium]
MKSKVDIETFEFAAYMKKMMYKAVKDAQDENRALGIPNVYAINGHSYCEMPDGRILLKEEYEKLYGKI